MRHVGSFLLLASAGLGLAQQGTDWFVVGVVGRWKLAENGAPITQGTPLAPDTKVIRDSANPKTGSLTLLRGGARFTARCEQIDCTNVIVPRDVKVPATAMEEILQNVLLAIGKEPSRYIATVSRGYGTLQNAVVKVKGKDIDLAPALADLGKGDVDFRLELVGAPAKAISVQHLNWDTEAPSSGVAQAAGPGLYRIRLTDKTGSEDSGEAWVLARQPADFESAHDTFLKFVTQLASLRDDVPPAGLKALEKARLEQLATAN